jgi:hypothetical protein
MGLRFRAGAGEHLDDFIHSRLEARDGERLLGAERDRRHERTRNNAVSAHWKQYEYQFYHQPRRLNQRIGSKVLNAISANPYG